MYFTHNNLVYIFYYYGIQIEKPKLHNISAISIILQIVTQLVQFYTLNQYYRNNVHYCTYRMQKYQNSIYIINLTKLI